MYIKDVKGEKFVNTRFLQTLRMFLLNVCDYNYKSEISKNYFYD